MASPELDEVVSVWQQYVDGLHDWHTLISGITPKQTPCGPVYEITPNPPAVGNRPNESFAIAVMQKVAGPHYHTGGETEIYIVISGLGRTYVGGREHKLARGTVVITPPETVHFTISEADLVLAVINAPPFNPHNLVEVHQTDPRVGFDRDQYEQLTASL